MFKLFNRYWSKAAMVSLMVEATLLVGSVWAAYHLRFWGKYGFFTDDWSILLRVSVFTSAVLLSSYLSGLYDYDEYLTTGKMLIELVRSISFAALALGALYYAFPFLFLGRGLFAISAILALVVISLWRIFLTWVLKKRLFSERILIVGSDEASRDLSRAIMERSHLGYQVVGFIADEPELQGVSLVNPKVIGMSHDLVELAIANQVTRVIVAQRDRRGQLNLDSLLRCKTKGIPVEEGKDYYERLTGQISLDSLRVMSWLVFSKGFVASPTILFFKRIVDISTSIFALILVLPLMILVMVAIKLTSPGSILYSQERLGRDAKPFRLWKFRSMSTGAEAEGKAVWAVKGDPRVTKVGRVLRKSRLDEIPQLWNVLVGDMSLVGPRPEREQFVQQLTEICPLYEQRLGVRPGLTGWAQIRAPYAATLEQSIEKLQYDLYYIKNLSIFFDLSIIASTLRTVLLGRGAQ